MPLEEDGNSEREGATDLERMDSRNNYCPFIKSRSFAIGYEVGETAGVGVTQICGLGKIYSTEFLEVYMAFSRPISEYGRVPVKKGFGGPIPLLY